jgi:hypothetical protein
MSTSDALAVPRGFTRIDTGRIYRCPLHNGDLEQSPVEMVAEGDTTRAIWINCTWMDADNRKRGEAGYNPATPQRHLVALQSETADAANIGGS